MKKNGIRSKHSHNKKVLHILLNVNKSSCKSLMMNLKTNWNYEYLNYSIALKKYRF